ncbi:bifunctional folylpolyglutamate synthase/dihydrofolate synthase [Faecalicatena acetigenes]|uniref:tetrahydrofolate synthase n=1 Tax=Faecalicatena acetigenes TaxID=2981790 RepID=A0ABT2TD22_9FIRM|nr:MULTISPECIES: folylpolyglutamate synthase/dihydrofolate synthase family protein [Lachnospiraceae]MCU6747906.1 bifunctional folylpolyglutamate synthase/dihydrofolate synthase [Faecalicatena acetigenes]SCI15296.1 Folylpolyglutamate synthase [uncultured Clostridium sp.]
MTYQEARVYLDEVSKYGSVLGLDTIRGLLRELGDPQNDLKFIHIAGTNGKGSVLAYTSTILSEAGYRIGRYVSPTVVSYLERIQIDGKMITEESFAGLTQRIKEAIARMKAAGKPHPTVFEIETAMAFLYFREEKCNLVVLETGLGGALDATNIIENVLCAVFASISRDHMGILGNTVEAITENKAGIIKQGCTVVTTRQQEKVKEILQKKANKKACPFIEADMSAVEILEGSYKGSCFSYKEYPRIRTCLAGNNQVENAVTALEIIEVLKDKGYEIAPNCVYRGMEKTRWTGRFSCILEHPLMILDGAHNEDAARRLYENVTAYLPGRRLIYIMGVFKDKEYAKIVQIMCPLAASVHTVDLPDKERSLSAEKLAEEAEKYCPAAQAEKSIENAVDKAMAEAGEEDAILVFGSLSYLGEVLEIVKKRREIDDR